MSVFRCYVEKKSGYDVEAQGLCHTLQQQLEIRNLTSVSIFNRYDADLIAPAVYQQAKDIVFSEPQVDMIYDETFPVPAHPHRLLAVEALPGQYDQRADSCAQCIQLLAGVDRPLIAAAKVYLLSGALSDGDMAQIRDYLINPVESREASFEKPNTLERTHPAPAPVAVLTGFTSLAQGELQPLLSEYGLAMDFEDLTFLQTYFREEERRDPTMTELRLVDTYWSDHCRHTTFSTHIQEVELLDREVSDAYQNYLAVREEVYGKEQAALRPQTLMDLATIGAKVLKQRGLLRNLDESEEINACSIRITAAVDGEAQCWLLMFKNETHNHPTEIEPFGGAATCIGGCIRDPLSGRAYVYQAMRLTGCGDPTAPLSQTIKGKLSQRKIATTAAAGYSSYGNQIGLATGHVAEVYHDGYIAKHLECGAVVGAAPMENVVRERPAPGDVVILLGGRTGRDGIGGATGSSKSHNLSSLSTMASEVQKGNAPEERKIQRLFRNRNVTRLIKRCNDFGAGGVSVAIGELADGLEIHLDAVRKKYDGLDATELAISESQERMAVVVSPEHAGAFISAARDENLEAYPVATVTASPRMVMIWRGEKVADLSRAFLNTNGAVKHASVQVGAGNRTHFAQPQSASLRELAGSLKFASRRGLTERFDGSIGSSSILMPFGGKRQRTPAQVMAALLPVLPGQRTDTASVMAWGFDPDQMSADPFTGAYHAVATSVAKLVAAGCNYRDAYLTFQEFFEKLRDDPIRWGKPFSALLGALRAQLDFGIAAIGGKDSMSGSFLDLDVPPTLISFSVAPAKAGELLSPEFKQTGSPVYCFAPAAGNPASLKALWSEFYTLCTSGKVRSAWAVDAGGVLEGIMNMSFGNSIGFQSCIQAFHWTHLIPGAIVAELQEDIVLPCAVKLGITTQEPVIHTGADSAPIDELLTRNERVLESVYPTRAGDTGPAQPISCQNRAPIVARSPVARPKAVIPVFPGTNCEYDTANACLKAGIEPEIIVVQNLTTDLLTQSALALERAIQQSQMVILPGGFSGGDEPDGSGKFIASFLRGNRISNAIQDLLQRRDGLMLGICNGFQALIKLGLVPYGEIRPMDASCPTLTYNLIGRHQSSYVTTRVASVQSPWMLKCQVGDLHTIPISHGEGRFVASESCVRALIASGQVATQYVDLQGTPTMDIPYNPNGSVMAIEGIFSPDGRVFGKMGHSERYGDFVGKNIPGNKFQPLFQSGVEYYK